MLTLLSVDIVSLQHIADFGVVMMLDKAPAMKSVRRPIMRAVSVPWTAGTAGKKFMLEMAQLYRRGTPNQRNPAYAAKVIELNKEWARQLKMKKAKAEKNVNGAGYLHLRMRPLHSGRHFLCMLPVAAVGSS